MGKKSIFIKILAIVSTFLVWLPILAPILFSLASIISERIFRFDYLMPAELFPIALTGGGLLIWVALINGLHKKLVIWSFIIASGSLVLGQILAVITGLASGEVDPSGWPWILVISSLIIYSLALIGIGIGGLLLLKNTFSNSPLKNTK
jgi:hypothetical protein